MNLSTAGSTLLLFVNSLLAFLLFAWNMGWVELQGGRMAWFVALAVVLNIIGMGIGGQSSEVKYVLEKWEEMDGRPARNRKEGS